MGDGRAYEVLRRMSMDFDEWSVHFLEEWMVSSMRFWSFHCGVALGT